MKWRSGIDYLFHNLPQLVDLDRKDPFVDIFVAGLGYRGLKLAVHCFHAMTKEILKSDDEREGHPAFACLLDYFHEVNAAPVLLGGHHLDVPRPINREIAG